MRKKNVLAFTATLILWIFASSCWTLGVRPVAAMETDERPVLLLYDSLAVSTAREGNIETLERLFAAYGVPVVAMSIDSYASGMLENYVRVAFVRNVIDLAISNEIFLRDLSAYGGDYLQIGGSDLPARARAKLGISIEVAPPDAFSLKVGDYGQTLPVVPDLDRIAGTSSEAKTYGSLSSVGGGNHSPYAAYADGYAYASYLARGSLTEIALAYVLKDWLHAADPYGTYLFVKEIYPFSDLELLKTLADKLYESGVPFVASVRPVFYNTDYPAMQRYLRALQYVQSRNGSIVIDAPAAANASRNVGDPLHEKMNNFIELLAENGIAPLGMGASLFWTYDKANASQGMSFFDSVFLEPNEEGQQTTPAGMSKAFAFSTYAIPFAQFASYEHPEAVLKMPMPVNLALSFDLSKDAAAMEDIVGAISRSWIPFADLKSGTHAVHTDRLAIQSTNGSLLVNGTPLDLSMRVQKVEEDYAYTASAKTSFAKLFSIQNQILMVIIGTSLAIFGLFFFIGYRRYKRKFLYPGGRNDSL
ncbi:hypothetical protein [Cohnella hashimotonis]|uniref:DUF2334 domain-containing protein n=1 Tax=Cohnella hashimotonis TaxID=2826895 RepID=A0ABT6TVC2_9BACL|nr:hypothetical protein [Cohnella hashimotonis]MDI4650153.1 hypothetical protein [Cohnella hashimotonis]